MRRLFNFVFYFLFTILVFGALSFPYWSEIKDKFFAPAPCSSPIAYKLGTFDKKFNISQKYFLTALQEAEAIWEAPIGKNLFAYEPDNTANILKINLIYDYRQEATSKLADLGIVVKDTEASYNSLKTKFESLKKQYYAENSAFASAVSSYNNRNKIYGEKVTYWNSQGGAPQKEYDELQAERTYLSNLSQELQKTQTRLNNMVVEINSMVVVLNRLASNLNLTVEKYNTIGSSRGETFEEGVYHRDALGQEIDIYEFSNKTKLVRVLAHELGHALGIDHVPDSKAIMYEKNQANALSLTSDDLNALSTICGAKK